MGSSPGVTPSNATSTNTRESAEDCEGACTSTLTPQQVREEYFKTYDVMTGMRIAATLGGMILVFGLFLLYKTKCKPRHHYGPRKEETAGIEYKVDGVNNVKDPSIHNEGFHSYAHFQARSSHSPEDGGRRDTVCVIGSNACGNQAHLSVMEDITYMDNNCDEIRIQIRTATPCEASPHNIFTWDNEEGACGGVACSVSAEPMCVLVPNHVTELRNDTSETKC